MSFGFGVGDVLQVTQLARSLIARIRNAGAQFAVFANDLNFAITIFEQLRINWDTYVARLPVAHALRDHGEAQVILRQCFDEIRDSFGGLERWQSNI